MSANSYIISSKGFFSKIKFIYDIETSASTTIVHKELVWVDNVRNAHKFTSKAAREFVSCHNLDAFIWQPYKEEPIIDQWKVIQRSNHYDFFNEENHCALEWKAVKVVHENKNDVKFLSNPDFKYDYYNEDEAKELAKEKNLAIIAELQKKMENQ